MSKTVTFNVFHTVWGQQTIEIPDEIDTDSLDAKKHVTQYLREHINDIPRCTDMTYVPGSARLDTASEIFVNGKAIPETMHNPYGRAPLHRLEQVLSPSLKKIWPIFSTRFVARPFWKEGSRPFQKGESADCLFAADPDMLSNPFFRKEHEKQWQDIQQTFDLTLPAPILRIGNLDTPDGHRPDALVISSGNLKDCFAETENNTTWYLDARGDLWCDIVHDENRDRYLYRMFRPDLSEKTKNGFLKRIAQFVLADDRVLTELTRTMIGQYTIRLGDWFSDVYHFGLPRSTKEARRGRWREPYWEKKRIRDEKTTSEKENHNH